MCRRVMPIAISLVLTAAAWSIPQEWKQWLPQLTRQDDFYSFWSTAAYQSALAGVLGSGRTEPFAVFSGHRQQTCRGEVTTCNDSRLTVPILHLTDWWAADDCIGPVEGRVSVHLTLLPDASRDYGWAPAGLPDRNACPLRDVVLTARHCMRYLLSMPDVHEPRVGLIGEGLGGAAAVALAALDPDLVAFVAVHEPAPGFHYLEHGMPADSPAVLAPLSRTKAASAIGEEQIRRTMTYFDFFNFAPEVKGPALVTMSQNDDVATPEQVLSIYNHLRCSKRLAVYEYENHLTDADREEFYYETYLWLQGIGYVQGVEKKRRGDKVMRLLQR